jgi:hypothetical protein
LILQVVMKYLLNILDFLERLIIVGLMLLIFLRIRNMDKTILKSLTYLRFDKIRSNLFPGSCVKSN